MIIVNHVYHVLIDAEVAGLYRCKAWLQRFTFIGLYRHVPFKERPVTT